MKKEKKEQLKAILDEKIDQLMRLSYEDLLNRVSDEPEVIIHGEPETEDFYQMEIEVFIEDKKSKNIRVSVSIDDGGFSAFFPISYGFTMTPKGEIP